jgi:DNA-binding Xre family transcriptional regulator
MKHYATSLDLAKDLFGDEIVQEMANHANATAFISALEEIRVTKDLSQRDLAKRIGWSHSKLHRFESSPDANLRWGDIVEYCKALDFDLTITFADHDIPAATNIKHHVLAIKKQLDTLVAIASSQNDDPTIVNKIHQFYGEVLLNFLTNFTDNHQRLPPIITPSPPAPPPPATPAPAAPQLVAKSAKSRHNPATPPAI